MAYWKSIVFSVLAGVLLSGAPYVASAQVSLDIGVQPVCPYGYFDYAPYNCSPYGYYGPDWFSGGLFIGAGPWFHGRRGFYGHVDNRYDPRHGYAGPFPDRNERAFNHFHPNESHDFQGHVGDAGHSPDHEHAGGFQGRHGGGDHGGGDHGGGHGGGRH